MRSQRYINILKRIRNNDDLNTNITNSCTNISLYYHYQIRGNWLKIALVKYVKLLRIYQTT